VVERSKIIDGRRIRAGDALVGLASTGLHSNGYSLARQVLLQDRGLPLDRAPDASFSRSLGEELLEPTRLYARAVAAMGGAVDVKGLAHITGSGIPGNLPRCLPEGTRAVLEEKRWPRPPIFDLIARLGGVAREEMFATFNMGLGMIAVVSAEDAAAAARAAQGCGVPAFEVGRVESGSGEPTAEIAG